MNAKVTILGCGNSTGVPAIGNHWGACNPDEPKNLRTRSSILVQGAETAIVVDTGPDFRQQLNRENVCSIDAVLYTHAHGDHINGIDELRVITYRNKAMTPIYGNQATLEELEERFSYLFEGDNHELYPPVVAPQVLVPAQFGRKMKIGDISFVPFEQDHGTCNTLGYRFGDFGYSVDMKALDETAVETLKGVKTWVVDGAGHNRAQNPVHASIEEIYALNEKIEAETVYITSLTLGMDYRTLLESLKSGYSPAYDGLSFDITF